MNPLCRYTASRLPDVFGAIRGIFFSHTRSAVCPPHLRRPIHGLSFQHINTAIVHPPTLRRRYFTFQPRLTQRYSRWYYGPRKIAVATVPLICIGGAVIADYGGYIETVPFTNRTHFVPCSPVEERELSESRFSDLKEKYASIILDSRHPDSVRVNNIISKLVRAVHNQLIINSHDTVMPDRGKTMEVLMRNLGNAWRAQPATGHLNGLNWEVIVVKDKCVTMWCFPSGKIIVPTGLLQVFRTDAELATMIAHEIGHVVARHWAEKIIYRKCLPRPLKVPFFRRLEVEADQIGMMLLAAAGFDPRVAPLAFAKLEGGRRSFLSYHPSSKKRSQLLSPSKIMEGVRELYREAIPHQDTKGSL